MSINCYINVTLVVSTLPLVVVLLFIQVDRILILLSSYQLLTIEMGLCKFMIDLEDLCMVKPDQSQ